MDSKTEKPQLDLHQEMARIRGEVGELKERLTTSLIAIICRFDGDLVGQEQIFAGHSVAELLEDVRRAQSYVLFDLEATRREKESLRRMLDEASGEKA